MINIELDTTAVDLDAEIETNTIELDAELTYRGEKGPIGKTPDIQIGEVETIEENEDATVIRRGTVDEPILDFKLPRGKSGIQGPQGPVGISGVYCGEKEPIDDEYKVWIIPDGMPSEYITDEEFIEKVNRAEEASYSLESNARYAREQGDYSKSIANSLLEAKAEGQFDGATFTPSVDSKGNLSWSNNKGLVNPEDKNIRGPQGPVGPQGEPFRIRKTYESIELMNDDFENMSIGDYVMIATSVNLEDNAKLYVKSEDSWIFITDFSGATGIQGEQGIQGIQGIQGPQGPKPVRGVDYFTENDISSMVKSITDNSNSEFNRNVTTAQENFNKNVSAKVSEFNDNAIQKVQSFNDSVDKLQSNINENSLAIKEIFNSLPTNIAKGKEIYINDAINRKVKSLKIYGKCEQKTTNGYQLFDESKLPTRESTSGVTVVNNADGSFVIEGNDTLSANFNYNYVYSHEETVKLLKAGNITISDDGVVGQTTVPYYFAQLRNSNGTIFEISSRTTNSYSNTITQEMLDDETTFLRIGFYGVKDTSITKKTIRPMLFQDGDGTFENFTEGKSSPNLDYPQEIKTLKGTRNLFNGILKFGSINNNTGDYESSNNCIMGEQYIEVIPNKKYSISTLENYSIFVHFYDIDKNYISYDSVQKTPKIITTPENCYYIRIRTRQAENITDLNSKIIVEEGKINHEYVPYGHWLRLNQRGKNYIDDAKASLKSSDGMTLSRNEKKLHISGSSTKLVNFWLLNLNEKLEVGTYSFSSNLNLEGKGRYVIRTDDGTVLLDNVYSNTFIVTKDTILSSILIQINANISLDSDLKIQLEKNDIPTEYEPFIKKYMLIDMNKENLFNVQEYVEKNSDYYTIDGNDNVTCIKTDSRSSGFEYYLDLPIGTYTLSTTNNCNMRVYESDDSSFPSSPVSFQVNNKNKIIFTTTKPYVTFKTFNASLPSNIGQIKLLEGTNTDDYYELASLDEIRDKLFVDEDGNVELVKYTEKIVLDEDRDYQLSPLPDSFECTRFRTNQVIPNNSVDSYSGLSNKLITRLPNSAVTDTECILFNNGYIYISIKKSRLESITEESFKKFMAKNPITICYKLEKKKIIKKGKIEPYYLYKGTNNIYIEDDLKSDLEVEYYVDVKNLIDRILSKISES